MAFLFGYIIVGNIVDNISSPKNLAIVLQVTLGVTWGLTGLTVVLSFDDGEYGHCDDNWK